MIKQVTIVLGLLLSMHAFCMPLKNASHRVEVSGSGEISVISSDGAQAVFMPEFWYYYDAGSPKVSWARIPARDKTDNINYRVVSWNKEQNVYKALNPVRLKITGIRQDGNRFVFQFHKAPFLKMDACLTLPPDGGEPEISYSFEALADGCFSIALTGFPERQHFDEVWQPLIWTQKRYPGDSYVTADFNCSMPLVATADNGVITGLCVSPESFPYQPLPTQKNCRFGVSLRNASGNAQPTVWAPLAGFPASKMKKGDCFSFSVRLLCTKASMLDMHQHLALDIYGLSAYHRDNSVCSLNTTLDNMIDYGMSQYSWFISEKKGCSYETDVKGSVKNTSSLNPLNIAFVADRSDIFEQRFMPIFEYLLSRDNLLFSLSQKSGEGGQKPSGRLGRPVIQASEAAAIYKAGGAQSPFLINEIQKEKAMRSSSANERYWREQLEMWYATSDKLYLDNAVAAAQKYLEENIYTVQEVFDYKNHSTSSFWCQLAPKYVDLYNLYEASGDRRFLDAAVYAARRYAQYIWMCPAIPSEKILVNEGDKAPQQKHFGSPMPVPEEYVDAWLVSEIGLNCECAATAGSHRGIFPAHHAAYMLRIAKASGDAFLEKIANWAIVGRYANFPGYHINTARTTVYQKPDFPLHTHYEMNVNSMHYNHVWPHMSIVLDYLVSQAETRSSGAIKFPPLFVEAFANLGSRIYGHIPGSWNGDEVILWMPQRLLNVSNRQFNYIAARNADASKLYLAFSNESRQKETAEVSVNPALVTGSSGSFKVSLPPGGFKTIVLDGIRLNVAFQDSMLEVNPGWTKDYEKDEYGRAMLINVAKTGKRVYAYVEGDSSMYNRACLRYRLDAGRWTDVLDCEFPFEFSIPVDEKAGTFEYQFILVDSNNAEIKGSVKSLYK